MKIELELPDETICAFVNFVRREYYDGLVMQSHAICSDDLTDGAIIRIDAVEAKEADQ